MKNFYDGYCPTFENYADKKDYDEAYDELRENNEPMIIDFEIDQDYELLEHYGVVGRLATQISLDVEKILLGKLKEIFNGKWTADSGEHDRNDCMVATVYVTDDDDTVESIASILDIDNGYHSGYSQEDNECYIYYADKFTQQLLQDVDSDDERLQKQYDIVIKSFSISMTIKNPTEKVISLFQ